MLRLSMPPRLSKLFIALFPDRVILIGIRHPRDSWLRAHPGGSRLGSQNLSRSPKPRITRQVLVDRSEFSLRWRDYLPKTFTSLRIRLLSLKPW